MESIPKRVLENFSLHCVRFRRCYEGVGIQPSGQVREDHAGVRLRYGVNSQAEFTLSYACCEVILNSTSPKVGGLTPDRRTKRMPQSHQAPFPLAANPSRIALHCITLASMQLIDMQHHSSRILPSPRRNPLHGCLQLGEKPPRTNQSIVAGAAIGTVGLACLVQLIGSWYCGNGL